MVGGGIFHLISLEHQFYSHMSVDEVSCSLLFLQNGKGRASKPWAHSFYPSTPEDIKTVIRTEEMSSCLHATDFRLYNASFLRLNAHLLSLFFFFFFYIIVCIVCIASL